MSGISPVPPGPNESENVKIAIMTTAVVSLIYLISKDAQKAFNRRAHWIPCDFLVLSAFSIQLLILLNVQNEGPGASSDFLIIHNSRTILCVFIAYVMPSMADHGLEHPWIRWVALVITVVHHVSSEFYIVKPNSRLPSVLRLWPRQNNVSGPLYYVCATIISICFVLLILLLACATIAARSIERIVDKRIYAVLSREGDNLCAGFAELHSCWRTVKSDFNRVDHRAPLYHSHHHSACLLEVEGAVLSAQYADINRHHHCWRTVEEALRGRVEEEEEEEEEDHHSCWQKVEDALVRGEKAEEEHHRKCWRRVEDAVLKAWIIVRAYSTQPVIGRSPLTVSAAIIVTVQMVTTIVGGLSHVNVFQKNMSNGENNKLKSVAIVLQCVFILMAWALINLRCATAVASQKDNWRSGFKIEDFWTRHLKELHDQARESPLEEAQSVDTQIDRLSISKKKTTVVPSILLSAAIVMQRLLVSFSKACWLVSLMIFHNRLMGCLCLLMFEEHIMAVYQDYPKYTKLLEDVQMLGDSPESLWIANHKSIETAKSLIRQGYLHGEYMCEDLVNFLSKNKLTRHGRPGLTSCLDPCKPQAGLNFQCKMRPIQTTQQSEEVCEIERQQSQERGEEPLAVGKRYYTNVSKTSWKMKAVSLLRLIVHLSCNTKVDNEQCSSSIQVDNEHCSSSDTCPPCVVKDCVSAYSQAWEIIDFVEEADTEADGFTSQAADQYFHALQKKVMERGDFSASSFRSATPESVHAALEELKKELKEESKSKKGLEGNDSMDWKALYKLFDSIECNGGTNVSALLESFLADIISECLGRVQHLLLVNSRKWALKRDERSMGKAFYTAGKAKAIMEKIKSIA